MALQSEISPPLVGDPNKDTKIDGDTKSDDNESSQSTDEDIDLEEGEIVDSGEEEEEEKKDLTNSSLKEALDKNFLKSIEQLVSQAKTDVSPPKTIANSLPPHNSPRKMKKRSSKYVDHDQCESASDQEDGWYASTRKHKSKIDSKPIDYRMELEAYRGTPPSSPDRKKEKKKRRSRKSKKSKSIKRKDITGLRAKYIKEVLKRRICKFFKEGKCAKGADCIYSHASPQPYKKKELCKFYLSGHCNKGNDCLFMHGEFPCKFYHTGSECYAKDACRFSHKPLTAEMQRVLDDYLNVHHGDDDYDRKRRNSPSPEPKGPPPKRTCLLGSPPRHIREAVETKRWQEEMLLQQQNHPGFKINISPTREDGSPPPLTKPNFYQETLPNTPPKRRINETPNVPAASNFPPAPPPSASGFPMPHNEGFMHESPDRYLYDEEDDYREMGPVNIKQEPPEFHWNEMHGVEHNLPVRNEMQPFSDPAQQELDFTRDVKFDETTQFSEMESSVDCNLGSPNAVTQSVIKQELEDENSIQEDPKIDDKTTEESSVNQEPVASPIIIPSHLPKKQQELFKRIQQRHRNNAVSAATSDVSNSPKSFDNAELQIKEEPKENSDVEKSESLLYSSEDDDTDDDEVVADVLKNLQKEPAPVTPPVKVESKSAAGLMELLNKINKNALEKNKTSSISQQGFIKNLLGAITSTPSETIQIPGLTSVTSEPKRRTLLPDPQPVPIVKIEPSIAPKDPRLKNRDPRTLSSAVNSVPSLPKTNTLEHSVSQASTLTPHEIINSAFTAKTTVTTEPVKEEIPYKLHGIYTKPLNYTPYIAASQSNPSLLKDPRLRKHMNLTQAKENGIENIKEKDLKIPPAKDIPPIPKLLLKYDKSDSLSINIFESNPVPKLPVEDISDPKTQKPKLFDPRMRRRDSQNSSGSNTPPHLTIVENLLPPTLKVKTAPVLCNEANPKDEKNWFLPALEKSWAPPPVLEKQSWVAPVKQDESDSEDNNDPLKLEIDEDPPSSSTKVNISNEDSSLVTSKKAKPTPPASHLPRAIADPRMAKLHNPLDSRRTRTATSESSNKNTIELKKSNQSHSPPNENLLNASKISTDSVMAESDSCSKTVKNVPKKQQSSQKSEEKKRTIHRNRKSSMDYASPLNSCDDSNSKSLSYNSYNQRPPRTGPSQTIADSSTSVSLTNSVTLETTPISDFLSDNSNLDCDNSSDVNLKDMFKTIDPTASPFC